MDCPDPDPEGTPQSWCRPPPQCLPFQIFPGPPTPPSAPVSSPGWCSLSEAAQIVSQRFPLDPEHLGSKQAHVSLWAPSRAVRTPGSRPCGHWATLAQVQG